MRPAAVGHRVDLDRAAARHRWRRLRSSTLSSKPFTAAQLDLLLAKPEARQHLRDLRQVAHEDLRQIDDVAPLRAHRHDRQAEQHAVGVGQLDRLLLGRAACRP